MIREPLVYIITANWNGLKDTLELLSSLNKIDYKNRQIVLIDNGSLNSESREIKKHFPKIHIIHNNTNTGYCKANNQGIVYALMKQAKYILLLNNDTIVKHNFLKILVNYAENNNFEGVLTPKILYYKKNIIWAMGGHISPVTSIPKMIGQNKASNTYRHVIEPDYASGCGFFVNSSVLKKVGVFNEIYFAYYEDTDLSYRIKRAGYKILAIPQSVIWHKVSRSSNTITTDKINSFQSYYLARNGLIFGTKILSFPQNIIYSIAQLLIKFPAYILLKCKDMKSRFFYAKGIIDGITYAVSKS